MRRLELLGPICWFEALTASRRTRHFLFRGIYALRLLYVLWAIHGAFVERPYFHRANDANLSAAFFQSYAYLQLWIVLLMTPAIIGTAFAHERERRTIDLLFLSSLSNRELIFGKLAARLAQVANLILTGLPILAIGMLNGGVDPASLFRAFLATSAALAMTAGVSISSSVNAERSYDALKSAYLAIVAMLFVTWIPYAVGSVLFSIFASIAWINAAPVDVQWLLTANPIATVSAALRTGSDSWTWAQFATAFVVQVAAGALAAAGGARRLSAPNSQPDSKPERTLRAAIAPLDPPRADRTLPANSPDRESNAPPIDAPPIDAEPISLEIVAARPPSAIESRAHKHWRMLDSNPVLWKELHGGRTHRQTQRELQLLAFVTCAVGIAIFACASELFLATRLREKAAVVTACWGISAVVVGFALLAILLRASSAISTEKERDCWTVLLATPLDRREIFNGKFLGALLAGRWLGLLAATMWLPPIVCFPSLLVAFLGASLIGIILAAFVAAAGLAISFRFRSSLAANTAAISMAIVLSGGYAFCCVALAPFASGEFSNEWLLATPCIPFLVAAPGMIGSEVLESGKQATAMLVPFIAGAIGYAVAASLLAGATSARFEAVAPRSNRLTPRRAGRDRIESNPS